jgi:hypothetical protein
MNTKDFMSYFKGFYIKTLDDKHAKEAIPWRETLHEIETEGGPKEFTIEKLKALNEKKAGIFFTPNNFSKAEGRKAEQCEGVNAWFMECDKISKEEQMERINKAKLPPSFIVETAKSYHTYWLAKDATIAAFKEIQTR